MDGGSSKQMRFYEFEAKALLGKYGIPLPKGSRVAKDGAEAEAIAREIAGPVVLKAQVLTGGRMKAGGVLFADEPGEARKHADRILGLEINGVFKAYPFSELSSAELPVQDELGGERIRVHFDADSQNAWVSDGEDTEIPSVRAFWFAWYAFHPKTHSVITQSYSP